MSKEIGGGGGGSGEGGSGEAQVLASLSEKEALGEGGNVQDPGIC